MLPRSVFRTSLLATLFVLFAFSTQAAVAATLTVDDDGSDCPAAGHSSIQHAINAANAGDTVVVCPGNYAEGPGTPGSNALTIDRSLTLKGAGADLVTIRPRTNSAAGGQIAANTPVLRDSVGNIITVAGAPSFPVDVDISGVTVSGGGQETMFSGTSIWDGEFRGGSYSEAGILFLDAGGSVSATRVTNIFTSGRPGAYGQPGGYRSNDLGYGIVQTSAATSPPLGATNRELAISGVRVDRYNRGGVLIDGATADSPPLSPSGVTNQASIVASQVVGRDLNSPPNSGVGGGPLLVTGPLFAQDGVKATAGSSVDVNSSLLSQNYMAGVGAGTLAEWPNSAGIRLIGAGPSSVTNSNVVSNSYGAVNLALDGTSADTASPLSATNDFWGYSGLPNSVNTGPEVSPGVIPNLPPAIPQVGTLTNPVNGTADPLFGSDSVHFHPFRNGSMADIDDGYWPIQDAPLPVPDSPPTVTLTANPATVGPGGSVELKADAADDFGVRSLTFYEGAEVIGTAVPPADSVTWEAPDLCGQHELSVVASDSLDQTGSDSVTVTVNDCPVPPVPPTISLTAPPASINQGGVEVNAAVDAPEGLGTVQFMLGNRVSCTLTGAPFTCLIVPTGAEVGHQTLRVIVTDAKGQTAEASSVTQVNRFAAAGLRVNAKRIGKRRTRIRTRGQLRRPQLVTAERACAGSRVTVIAGQGRRRLINRQVNLNPNCGYNTAFGANRRQPVRIRVQFPGNETLRPISNSARVR